jgi:PPK2 family polyphosphate:nucleotide phosphotransferase
LLQERLYAERKRGLLIVLQAVDAGGKDGAIRHVMKGINPQGCRITSFKVPTPEELAHDFLWRVHQHVPARGFIGVFNRSHYEDVLVTRVHELIADSEVQNRFEEINDFERMLVGNGTTILKFYLAISKDEQRRRLQARLDDPRKHWKFSPSDLAERRFWDRYLKAYAEAISATSTKHAPWFVIPANHEWYRNYLVAKIIVATLKKMDPQYPPPPEGIDFRKVKIPT